MREDVLTEILRTNAQESENPVLRTESWQRFAKSVGMSEEKTQRTAQIVTLTPTAAYTRKRQQSKTRRNKVLFTLGGVAAAALLLLSTPVKENFAALRPIFEAATIDIFNGEVPLSPWRAGKKEAHVLLSKDTVRVPVGKRVDGQWLLDEVKPQAQNFPDLAEPTYTWIGLDAIALDTKGNVIVCLKTEGADAPIYSEITLVFENKIVMG